MSSHSCSFQSSSKLQSMEHVCFFAAPQAVAVVIFDLAIGTILLRSSKSILENA